jgi:hypothetical protein
MPKFLISQTIITNINFNFIIKENKVVEFIFYSKYQKHISRYSYMAGRLYRPYFDNQSIIFSLVAFKIDLVLSGIYLAISSTV